jgi:hypothetical protein
VCVGGEELVCHGGIIAHCGWGLVAKVSAKVPVEEECVGP